MKRINIFVSLFFLLLSGCGPGQLFGPTITPTPTNTSTSTSTSTPTPTPTLTPTNTPTPTSSPTKVPVVFYSDDFSSARDWLQSSGYGAKYQYSGGQYVISRPKGNYENWACANRNFLSGVLTVDAMNVSGDPETTGTIILWDYVDNNNFNQLTVQGNGDCFFWEQYKGQWVNGSVTYLYASPFVNKGQQINHIAISFDGNESTIYTNNHLLFKITYSHFPSGDICLGAASGETSAVEVSFDNLVIYTIDSWTPPR